MLWFEMLGSDSFVARGKAQQVLVLSSRQTGAMKRFEKWEEQ